MRVAVVGLGSIGRRHVRIIQEFFPDIKIIVVRREESSYVFEEQYAEKVLTETSDAISEKLDAAIIASPATKHVEQAIDFISNSIPVLIEKPLSNLYREALRLRELKSANLTSWNRSLVGYVLRYYPPYERVKKILQRPYYGAMRSVRVEVNSYLPEWRPEYNYLNTVSAKKELGGGVLRELSHELDYINKLFGPIGTATGWKNEFSTLHIDADEHVELLMVGVNELPISVKLDFATQAPAYRRLIIDFEYATIELDFINSKVSVKTPSKPIEVEEFEVERNQMFYSQFNHFLEVIKTHESPECTLDEGIEVMAIIDAVERSFSSKRWERVE
jgi:predicted dehydrogenase